MPEQSACARYFFTIARLARDQFCVTLLGNRHSGIFVTCRKGFVLYTEYPVCDNSFGTTCVVQQARGLSMLKPLLVAITFVLVSFIAKAELYVWRDANGVQNYSDTPPLRLPSSSGVRKQNSSSE